MKCIKCNKTINEYDKEKYKNKCLDCYYNYSFFGMIFKGLTVIMLIITCPFTIPLYFLGKLYDYVVNKVIKI